MSQFSSSSSSSFLFPDIRFCLRFLCLSFESSSSSYSSHGGGHLYPLADRRNHSGIRQL